MRIDDLVSELKRLKKNSLDVVVDSRNLQAVPGDEVFLKFRLNGGEKSYPLTEWAHRQLSEKTQIPWKYYSRMLESGKTELLCENINAWLEERERRLLRIQENRVRAVLSDRYRPLDHLSLLFVALEEFKKHKVNILRCDLTERFLFVKVLMPYHEREVREGDKVVPGLILSNSEVGAGSFKVEPFYLRLICKNGLIGEQTIRKIHLGEKKKEGLFWSDETLRKRDELLWSEVRDVISATFSGVSLEAWIRRFQDADSEEVKLPSVAVKNVSANYEIPASKEAELLSYFLKEDRQTQWTLGNAVSRVSQELDSIEERIRLERAASEVIGMPKDRFRELISENLDKEVQLSF